MKSLLPDYNLLIAVIARLRMVFPRSRLLHTLRVPDESFSPQAWKRSVFIRVVDCGSSNAAELEINSLFNPVYDAEQYGFQLVASPRHADLLLITGPISRNMEEALLAAFHAMPEPRRVVTLGDDLADNSPFNKSYAVVPLPEEISAVRVAHIPGDPPAPLEILEALLRLDLMD